MEENKKIVIKMLSKADSVEGQGVGSAYLEQVKLVKETSGDIFEVIINKHKKCDILHVHSINPSLYIRMRCANKKTKKVMYCHFLPQTLKDSLKLPKGIFRILASYVMSFYKHADYLVVVNPIFIDELNKLGVKKERIVYIPNYVNDLDFYPITDKNQLDEIKDKYHLDKTKKIIISAGQVQSRKGVLDFVEVAKRNPVVLFVWCGGFSFGKITEGYDELKKVVENPPENVKFLGIIPRKEMNAMFNISDALFMPSYNELFPMTILEAASVEKPIILRDLDLYKPILFENKHYFTNNEEFDAAIKRLLSDEKYYEDLKEDSLAIKRYYSKNNVGKLWREFYLSILKK